VAKQRVALVLSVFALGLAGCGGDDDEETTTIPTIPLSVPGGSDTDTTAGDESTDTTVDTTPDSSAAPAPTPTPAPAPTPAPPAQTPDSPQNDTPPPQGSEAEEFENFCEQNPGAC
jgi:hypothetical protein